MEKLVDDFGIELWQLPFRLKNPMFLSERLQFIAEFLAAGCCRHLRGTSHVSVRSCLTKVAMAAMKMRGW